MIEEWRPVAFADGRYSVSSLGRVRLEVASRVSRAGRVLKAARKDGWYEQVRLAYAPGRAKVAHVHRLVAEAFLGPRPAGMEINHKNGRKADNRLENLEYVTRSENARHAHALGLSQLPPTKGESNSQAKLSNDAVREIRRGRAAGLTQKVLAERFGVSESCVALVEKGRSWRHVA